MLGHHRAGQPIVEVRIDRWRDGTLGHVIPGEPKPVTIPPGLEGEALNAWARGLDFRERLEIAVAARLGGLFGRHPWHSDYCAGDRVKVLRCCPEGWKLAVWEQLVELRAEAIAGDERYIYAHRHLVHALLEQQHEPMDGVTAFAVLDAALASYDAERLR